MALELRPGVVIADKLRLLRQLGHGGMGVVWAARHETLETDVAVKLIRPERGQDDALIARFEREAKTTARIQHPHVVHVMDFGSVDAAVPYIVMELLSGFSLAELLESGGRLSLASALVLVQQVGSALASAHERGVVHRDIKPHNIFVLEESRGYPLFVKVLDFGIAKMLSDTQVPGGSQTLTETGAVIGSPPYMSPEQIEGKPIDLRTDLWSLGVIVYECLTGQRPFQGSSFVGVGAAILNGTYTPARELRPNLPRAVEDWLSKVLNLDPSARFSTAAEMVEAFQRAAAESTAPGDAVAGRSGVAVASAASGFESTLDATPPVNTGTVDADSVPVSVGKTASQPPIAVKGAAPRRRRADSRDGAARDGAARDGASTDTDASTDSAVSSAIRRAPRGKARRLRSVVMYGLPAAAVAGTLAAVGFMRSSGAADCPAGMVKIPSSTFRLGSAPDGETPSDEAPQQRVTLDAFCLDKTEVSGREYAKCKDCAPLPRTVQGEGLTPNAITFWSQFCNAADALDHPVNCVDLPRAVAFCESQGKRLPTETEWELAARGPEARTFPWGESAPTNTHLNACGAECSELLTERLKQIGRDPWPRMHEQSDGAPTTAPVGTHPEGASESGIFDLAGNVWEWTSSHYCRYDDADCGDSRRVIRGGGWDTVESQDVRSARRLPSAPNARSWSVGFRCAKSL